MTANRSGSLTGLVVIAVLTVAAAGCSSASEGATIDSESLLQRRCGVCHTLERVDAVTKDRAGWLTTIDRMRTKGAAVNDAESQQLADYLESRGAKK